MHGDWLREARERKGWTQEQAATRLGVSQTYLSLLENGRRVVSRRLAKRLQRDFVVPATALPVQSPGAASDAQSITNARISGH